MDGLPAALSGVLEPFAPGFRHRTWARAQLLLVGARLCPAPHAIAAALRVLDLDQSRAFSSFHRVLSRACGSGLAPARIRFSLPALTASASLWSRG